MLGEPIGRHRAATWLGLSACTWILSAVAVILVGQGARDRSQPARGGLRHVRARARCRDSVVAGVHRHVPVDRRRGARPARRAGRAGARVLDPHAGDVVRADHARGRRIHRAAGDPGSARPRARSDIRSEDDDLGRRYSHRDDLGRRSAAERGALARDAVPGDRERARAARPRLRGRVRRRRLDRRKPLRSRRLHDETHERRRRAPAPELRQSCRAAGRDSSRRAATSSSRSTPTSRTIPPRSRSSSPSSTRGSTSSPAGRRVGTIRLRRRLFSRVFNWMTGVISGVRLHDVNCGLKAYRAEVLQGMRLYGELHRFIPVLARVPWIPDRGDPGEPPSAAARPLALRARALPARLLRSAQRHVHGALPPSAAPPVRRHRRSSWARSGSSILTYLTVIWFWGHGDRPPSAPDPRCAADRRGDPVRLARTPLGADHLAARGADGRAGAHRAPRSGRASLRAARARGAMRSSH